MKTFVTFYGSNDEIYVQKDKKTVYEKEKELSQDSTLDYSHCRIVSEKWWCEQNLSQNFKSNRKCYSA